MFTELVKEKKFVGKYITMHPMLRLLQRHIDKDTNHSDYVGARMVDIADLLRKELIKEGLMADRPLQLKDFIYCITKLDDRDDAMVIHVKHRVIRYFTGLICIRIYDKEGIHITTPRTSS